MISKTKFEVDRATVAQLFRKADLGEVRRVLPMDAGEFNAVYSVTADGMEYAIKIAPKEGPRVLTYEKDMMRSEVFWYSQIKEYTDIPIPKIYYSDFSRKEIPADFFIMEKLNAKLLSTVKLSEEEKNDVDRRTAIMAAQIHKVKNDRYGYVQNGLYDNWYSAIRSMTENLISDCRRAGRKTPKGEKLLSYIDKYKDVLSKAPCAMVNFDLGPYNIMVGGSGDSAKYYWIDPERTFWGDPIADFVCLDIMNPLENKGETIKAYNSAADVQITASDNEKIRYAVAEAYLALIMEAEKYYRYTPRHFGWWRNVAACKYLYGKAFSVLRQ